MAICYAKLLIIGDKMRTEKEIRCLAEKLQLCEPNDYFVYQKIFMDALNYVLGAKIPNNIKHTACDECEDATDECGDCFDHDKCVAIKETYLYDEPIDEEYNGEYYFNDLLCRASIIEFYI